MPKRSLLATLSLLCVAACATTTVQQPIPEPVQLGDGSAYQAAAIVELPAVAPEQRPGMHNVYRLSDQVISGSEPETEEALEAIAGMGVKTILSVDGKAPDHVAAERLGMRYVHVPIRYRGITRDEALAIAKTFYELEGPFYVHCFHGVHRGPAAAAIGRVILDGAPREQAIAEMRQWCGTSQKYEGLYATIAVRDIPTAAEAAAFDFDFPAEHRFRGLRQGMVDLSRSWDLIAKLAKRDWQPMEDHPDANARNEADKLAGAFEQLQGMELSSEYGADYDGWLDSSLRDTRRLAAELAEFDAGDPEAGARARDLTKAIKASCTDCHAAYRN